MQLITEMNSPAATLLRFRFALRRGSRNTALSPNCSASIVLAFDPQFGWGVVLLHRHASVSAAAAGADVARDVREVSDSAAARNTEVSCQPR